MRKLLVILAMLSLFAGGCSSAAKPAEQPEAQPELEEPVSAVIYFSATGTAKHAAEMIADQTGADLIELEAEEPYTETDLDYGDDDSRTSIEQNDYSSRPALKSVPDVKSYSTIYLGYPIWWGEAPRILDTFVESVNLNGKTVIPFCTSGSSPIGSSAENLADLANGGTWLEGTRFGSNPSNEDILTFTDR